MGSLSYDSLRPVNDECRARELTIGADDTQGVSAVNEFGARNYQRRSQRIILHSKLNAAGDDLTIQLDRNFVARVTGERVKQDRNSTNARSKIKLFRSSGSSTDSRHRKYQSRDRRSGRAVRLYILTRRSHLLDLSFELLN